MVTSLFRQEVKDAPHLEERLELYIPTRYRVMSLAILIVILTALVSTTLLDYSPVTTVRGALVSSEPVANIVASRPGVITEVFVSEHAQVYAGQKLLRVRIQQPAGNGTLPGNLSNEILQIQEEILGRQNSLERQKELATRNQLTTRLTGLREEEKVLSLQIEVHEQLVQGVQTEYERLVKFSETGIISREQLQRSSQAILDRKSRLYELKQQLAANRSQQRNISSEIQIAKINSVSKMNDLDNSSAELNRLRAVAGSEIEYLLKAPISGRVANLRAARGKYINEKTTLLSVLPNSSDLDAELSVPSDAIGGVKIGQQVVLMYDAFPFERFGGYKGKIAYVAKMPSADSDGPGLGSSAKATYTVRINSVKPPSVLQIQNVQMPVGGTFTAKIVLDRVSVFETLTAFGTNRE